MIIESKSDLKTNEISTILLLSYTHYAYISSVANYVLRPYSCP